MSSTTPLPFAGKSALVTRATRNIGAEIGLTTMQSLRNLYIVEGRIGMSAALIRGRCQKHGDCALFEVAEADAAHAVVEVKKRGWPASRRVSWSIADAERAGLIKEDQPDSLWRRWPQEMCVARATTRAASMYFPEITSVLLSEEDLRDMSAAAGTPAVTAGTPAVTALPIAGRAPGVVTPPSLSALDAFAAAGAAAAPSGPRTPAGAGGRHEPSTHARAARKPPKRADPGRNGGRARAAAVTAPASTAAARQRKKSTAAGRNGR